MPATAPPSRPRTHAGGPRALLVGKAADASLPLSEGDALTLQESVQELRREVRAGLAEIKLALEVLAHPHGAPVLGCHHHHSGDVASHVPSAPASGAGPCLDAATRIAEHADGTSGGIPRGAESKSLQASGAEDEGLTSLRGTHKRLNRCKSAVEMEGDQAEEDDRVSPRGRVGALMRSTWYQLFVGVVICTNCGFVGLEIQANLEGNDTSFFFISEFFFLFVYITEICLQLFVDKLRAFRDPWLVFDTFIVVCGVLSVSFRLALSVNNPFDTILVFRVMRLLRLARAFHSLRTLSVFADMWKLISGIMSCIKTVLSAFLLLVIAIYVFACIGADIIAVDKDLMSDDTHGALFAEHFGSLWKVMFTLLQFTTLDSAAGVYRPLIFMKPSLLVFIIPFILLVSIALMNLVSAVIVDNAIKSSSNDLEMKKWEMRRKLKSLKADVAQVFRMLDKDGAGTISPEEIDFSNIVVPTDLQDIIVPEKLNDIFEILDADGSGEIDENEFVDGIAYVCLSDVPVETVQILQLLRNQRSDMESLVEDVAKVKSIVATKLR